MSDDYRKDLEIDFSRLDENWRDHSINYMEWSEKWANAVAERDRIKERLDLAIAELDREIRQEYASKKPTEAAIKAMITEHDDYKYVADLLIQHNERVNILSAARSAFESRKKALEGLTQLWVNGYWSEPNISAKAKEQNYIHKQVAALNENERLKRKLK